jgi:hypothetical protein
MVGVNESRVSDRKSVRVEGCYRRRSVERAEGRDAMEVFLFP